MRLISLLRFKAYNVQFLKYAVALPKMKSISPLIKQSSFAHIMTADEAAMYTKENVLGKDFR